MGVIAGGLGLEATYTELTAGSSFSFSTALGSFLMSDSPGFTSIPTS
jgi:hypothetical protein